MHTWGADLMTCMWKRFRTDEAGASMAEYGLLVALIAVVAAIGVGAFGTNVRTMLFDLAAGAFPP
jgi:pilus assembly protein Flp/PilA